MKITFKELQISKVESTSVWKADGKTLRKDELNKVEDCNNNNVHRILKANQNDPMRDEILFLTTR